MKICNQCFVLLLTSPMAFADLTLEDLELGRSNFTLATREVAYDADSDFFTLSRYNSDESAGWLFGQEVSTAFESSTDLFIGKVNEDGQMESGFLTIIGTIPELEIETPSLLLQATAVGYISTILGTGIRQDGTEQGFINHRIILENVFSHQALQWGTHTVINNSGSTGNSFNPFPGPILNEETLFTESWASVAGLNTYYRSANLIAVATPSTAALLAIGLFVIRNRFARLTRSRGDHTAVNLADPDVGGISVD